MLNVNDIRRYVIRPVLSHLSLYSEVAEELLVGTISQESRGGTYLHQINGVALGIYQIEPATHVDVFDNYLNYRPQLKERVLYFGDFSDASLLGNLHYATAIARIIYLRAPEPLPETPEPQLLAQYYKRYYNTSHGKATVEDFIKNYEEYSQ